MQVVKFRVYNTRRGVRNKIENHPMMIGQDERSGGGFCRLQSFTTFNLFSKKITRVNKSSLVADIIYRDMATLADFGNLLVGRERRYGLCR